MVEGVRGGGCMPGGHACRGEVVGRHAQWGCMHGEAGVLV